MTSTGGKKRPEAQKENEYQKSADDEFLEQQLKMAVEVRAIFLPLFVF